MNIVLLEDDADSREALAALLSLESFTVRQAHDSASFSDVTRDLRGNAVIFDLFLQQDISGLSLVMEYQSRRQAAGLQPAKLIALSGSADAEALLHQARPPFPIDHRFTKPASHREILAALHA
jgi:DNA-binding response OmpR family regulator